MDTNKILSGREITAEEIKLKIMEADMHAKKSASEDITDMYAKMSAIKNIADKQWTAEEQKKARENSVENAKGKVTMSWVDAAGDLRTTSYGSFKAMIARNIRTAFGDSTTAENFNTNAVKQVPGRELEEAVNEWPDSFLAKVKDAVEQQMVHRATRRLTNNAGDTEAASAY